MSLTEKIYGHAWSFGDSDLASKLRDQLEPLFHSLPWPMVVRDWKGGQYRLGGGREHWFGAPLVITIKTASAGRKLLARDGFGFLESFLRGDVELDGNLYILPYIRRQGAFSIGWLHGLGSLMRNIPFQNQVRARLNIGEHYDIPQEAIDLYLDRVYLSYSCALFEDPSRYERAQLVKVGEGKGDTFDSLEKAQWRKFSDAIEWMAPEPGDRLLDVGCGYGGQMRVALESAALGKVVGWTQSKNQAQIGSRLLAAYDADRWELHEGDYRQETRLFDHITSVGMVSHVGPRGLEPYVRKIRASIRKGGRYLHHALMVPHVQTPHDLQLGLAFNERYMWPGFHWFTLGAHIRALERNGFEVERATNLSPHYAKTTAAWYERMMARETDMVGWVGEPAFRAKRIFLAGISGAFVSKDAHVYRVYCHAV